MSKSQAQNTYTVTLLPECIQFTVKAQQSILEAALNSQIDFPHRCQVGACAMCMCRKLSGSVDYHLEPMLTEQEQADGWIFSCQAYATSDLELTFQS